MLRNPRIVRSGLLLVSIFLFLALPFVNAQATCASTGIPVYGRWGTHTIPVYVPGAPSPGYRLASKALQTWNDAQTWFQDTYYPNSSTQIYTFVQANQSASKVQVTLKNGSSSVFGGLGRTYWQVAANTTTIVGAQVYLAVDYGPLNTTTFTTILHELGHALGLMHAAECSQDLMWGGNNEGGWQPQYGLLIYPSTLDLYALHMSITANASASFRAILPSSISYMQYPTNQLPVPEFSSYLLMFVVLSCIGGMLQLMVRRGRQ